MANHQDTSRIKVYAVFFDGFTSLDAYGPIQVFQSSYIANPDGSRHTCFEIVPTGLSTGIHRSGSDGPATQVDVSFAQLIQQSDPLDVLLVPGGWATRTLVKNTDWIANLKLLVEKARIVATVCTGACLLGKTGFLDGKEATTNKLAWDWVVSECPNVKWQSKARWVSLLRHDTDNRCSGVITSSGVSAGIDMTLALVQELKGKGCALSAARAMEYVWNSDASNDPFSRTNS